MLNRNTLQPRSTYDDFRRLNFSPTPFDTAINDNLVTFVPLSTNEKKKRKNTLFTSKIYDAKKNPYFCDICNSSQFQVEMNDFLDS